MHSIIEIKEKPITYEYIRGLIEGEGCFTFCSSTYEKNGVAIKHLIPTFALAMCQKDENLLHLVARKLRLRNKLLIFKRIFRRDGYNRQPMVRIMVRHPGELRNIIIPLCNKKLIGNKGIQFEEWIERIGNDPAVPEGYRFLYLAYKNGFFDKMKSFDY